MIKATITWIKTQYFLQATRKLVVFFTFFKKVIFLDSFVEIYYTQTDRPE